jgi:alpha/beta superfamily hydrolase
MNDQEKTIDKPGKFWLITEFARAAMEYTSFIPYKHFMTKEYEGDSHPVIVLPGFMSGDVSTKPLRQLLEDIGYTPYGWGLGRNYGDEEDLELLLNRIDKIYHEHRKSISVIGWSLGGIYARQLAKSRPHLIRQVITLGSPFSGITDNNHAVWIHKLITSGKGEDIIDPELLADIPKPAPVPTTAIFSKQDGVVPWQYCIEEKETAIHQNIQVYGSHLGLGVNPTVIEIIIDRLKYEASNWRKFELEPASFSEKILYPA